MNGQSTSYRLVTAAALLMAYLILAAFLLWLLYNPVRGTPAPEWSNVLVIFNAIGALATAAVGVLLGVEVQQENVNSAQRRAEHNAAQVARKDMAIVAALGNLDNAMPAAAAAGSNASILQARAALHAALLGSAATDP